MSAAWVLRRAALDLRRQRWSLAGLAAAFALAAMLAVAYRWGAGVEAPPAVSPGTAQPAQVIAYLREDLEPAGVHKLREALAHLPGVQHVALVSGEEAVVRLRRALGERGRLLDGTDDGLLPASLEVWLSPGGDPITRAHQLAWRLQRLDGIVDADVIDARPERDADAWRSAARAERALWLASAIAAGAALLVGAGLGGWRQRRDELRVLLALGFTRGALLAPAILLALAAALIGSAAGLGLAGLARRLTLPWFASGAGLTALDWCAGLLAAALLGALAGVARGVGPDVVDAR
ncbi:MAG TPA: permease-like cell division protein FtsX [Polyangia bacterium]|nr:permease-like cell division protein FtsX [Polyangia bacterium]